MRCERRSRRAFAACGPTASTSTTSTASTPRCRSSRRWRSWPSIATPARIAHVGISEASVEEVERARAVVPIEAVQNHYNLTERRHEEVVDYCASAGILFVPYFPLRGGGPPELDEIAARHDATPSQIILAWLLRRSSTMLPIPGTLSLAHLRENLGALEIALTDAEFEALM